MFTLCLLLHYIYLVFSFSFFLLFLPVSLLFCSFLPSFLFPFNDDVVEYLDSKNPVAAQNSADEPKFSLASQAEVQKVVTKIRLESQQVTGSLDWAA